MENVMRTTQNVKCMTYAESETRRETRDARRKTRDARREKRDARRKFNTQDSIDLFVNVKFNAHNGKLQKKT